MYVWIYNKVSLIEVVHKVVDLLADHYTRVRSTTICCHVLVQRLALAVAMMTVMVILIYVI